MCILKTNVLLYIKLHKRETIFKIVWVANREGSEILTVVSIVRANANFTNPLVLELQCLMWCAGHKHVNESCIKRAMKWQSSIPYIQLFEHHTVWWVYPTLGAKGLMFTGRTFIRVCISWWSSCMADTQEYNKECHLHTFIYRWYSFCNYCN
jgi:hypothetical protein